MAIADSKAQTQGVEGVHEFIDQACVMFEKLAVAFGPMRTREGLIAALDQMALSEEDRRWSVPMVEHFGHFVREALTALFEIGIKDLPPVPGGRRRVLTASMADKINDYVLYLFRRDVDLKRCKLRAAQKFGVSYTTVQRAWSSRQNGEILEVDAGEFVDYVRKKMETWITPDASLVEVAKTEYKALVAEN